MVIWSGSEPSREQAADFCVRWPDLLQERLEWFALEAGLDGPDLGRLDEVVRFVAAHLTDERPAVVAPEGYDPSRSELGWTDYGAALAEGLIAHVCAVYSFSLDAPLDWSVREHPGHPDHLRPYVRVPDLGAPWLVVLQTLRGVRDGTSNPIALRISVLNALSQVGAQEEARRRRAAASARIEATPIGRRQWHVRIPQDIEDQLGERYAELEQIIVRLDGVKRALMENRDLVLVTTARGVEGHVLESRINQALGFS